MKNFFSHCTAIIEDGAIIGDHTKIWAFSHVMGKSRIGKDCNIGQNVFIDNNTEIGDHCKLQNNVNIYEGVTLEDYVFCGPSMTFTNVKAPRCKYPRERGGEFYLRTLVKSGASIGAHAVIVCGVTIGKDAFVGSGSVVTKDVQNNAIVVGNPARKTGWICECGTKLIGTDHYVCNVCKKEYKEVDGELYAIY